MFPYFLPLSYIWLHLLHFNDLLLLLLLLFWFLFLTQVQYQLSVR